MTQNEAIYYCTKFLGKGIRLAKIAECYLVQKRFIENEIAQFIELSWWN